MMKTFCLKLSNILKTVFGYGIMIVLFAGGLTFFGYMAALIVGGGNTYTCQNPDCGYVINLSDEETTVTAPVKTVENEGEEAKTVCASCDKDLKEGAKLCTKCNACPKCGTETEVGLGGAIANVISKTITPWIIIASTVLVLVGLLAMYLAGEKSLTPEKKKRVKHEGEM